MSKRQLENTVEIARKEIPLLREYRTRLIADVVTGKLDVREAAARLPEDGGHAGPDDESPEEAEEVDNEEAVPDEDELEEAN